MVLRWIHNAWKYFWRVVLILLLFIVIVGGGIFGILQLDTSKNYIANQIEDTFNNRFYGELSIGDLNGLMPFRFELDDVRLLSAQSSDSLVTDAHRDTLISISRLNTQIDLWSLLQNKISIVDFQVQHPRVQLLVDGKSGYTLDRALQARNIEQQQPSGPSAQWIKQIEIIAPLLTVQNGTLYVEQFHSDMENLELPEPFEVNSINTTMFLELSEVQRFLDFEYFSANLPNLSVNDITFSGQIYNDSRFLEFNSFNITTPQSELTVSGQIDGFNPDSGGFQQQLMAADYDLDINSERFLFTEFSDFLPGLPRIEEPLDFSLAAAGNIDSLQVDYFDFGIGESFLSINGLLEQLDSNELLNYQFDVQDLFVRKSDLEVITGPLEQAEYQVFESLRMQGHTAGTLDSLSMDLDVQSPAGEIALNAFTQLKSPYKYNGSLSAKRIDAGPFSNGRIDTTNLNIDATFNGIGFDLSRDLHNMSIALYSSSVDGVEIEAFDFDATLIDGFLEHQYSYQTVEEQASGSGWVDFTKEENQFALKGSAANLDLARFLGSTPVPKTRLNLDYNVELQGLLPDRIQGRANLDVQQSVVGSDTVQPHQIYMDLNSPDLQSRTFRLTSTLFDLSMTGDLKPSNIFAQANYWSRYLSERVREEVLLDSLATDEAVPAAPDPLMVKGELVTKDLSLVRKYWPNFPRLVSDSRLSFDVRGDANRLLLSADSQTDTLIYNTSEAHGATARMTASFRHDRALKEFANIDFQTTIDSLHTELTNMDSLRFDFSLRQDSLLMTSNIANISNEARSRLRISSLLSPSQVVANIEEFYLGNSQYAWQNEATPTITLQQNGRIQFEDFRFLNDQEYMELRGSITENRQDSLLFVLRDINLQRISNLVGGKVSFNGTMNGTLTTRSLLESPSIQGNMQVERLRIDDRMVGDATFHSQFNAQKNRFDTSIDIVTDSTKYGDYLSSNDGVGQRIHLDGYFVPPNPEAPHDTSYYFDANLEEIDLWIVPYIAPNVFQEVEGVATGEGYITGNSEDYDFNLDFNVQNAFAKPKFLNTNYFLNGDLTFNRQNWLVLDSLNVTDTKGGRGLVYGSVDINNFNPITYLDLTMEMDQLHILNSNYDPDVPFYGSMSGSGSLRLTGPNNDLFLRTQTPISITSDSRLYIPLMEETELNENTKFIQFVDEFRPNGRNVSIVSPNGAGEETEQNLNEMLENLTFSERFNLDLQFNANTPMTVELIFDREAGEVLTAQGTGQIRLTMEEENTQIFGRYNITSGRYIFVGGEIITRPLQLESGGTIIWEGAPDNARININAIYNARPSVAPLTGVSETEDEFESQRVPIDLVVEITGTLSSIENNYYFRIPSTFSISSNSTLSAQISDLNRDEQEKLIQATSILLTGNFISYQSTNEAYSSIGQSLTRRSTYLNPLLSSQVISPLLSNQINALLNSDVSRFDIDFSLNAYNEIDLGVALRLYNDRLILRREGMITDSDNQTTLTERIGDLNATYRINRSLSVMAFHRQDQTLGNVTPTPGSGSTVDGIGLEAQVKFNSWKDFFRRIKNTILGIFGAGPKEEDDDETLASETAVNATKE